MIITTPEQVATLLELINSCQELAYDVETDGLNPRKNRIIGFGVGTFAVAAYVPVYRYDVVSDSLVRFGVSDSFIKIILQAISRKQLLMFNASFDARFTKSNFKVDLLPSLHADVLLLKHTCDEEFPFGLKEISAKLYGQDVKSERAEMLASVKAKGGTATQFYKADTEILAKYCMQDCVLTHRLYKHYSKELVRQGLEKFFYEDEVMLLYKQVTVPMTEQGVHLDMNLLQLSLKEICTDLQALEKEIQQEIVPMLGPFEDWLLNKEYPLKKTGRLARALKTEDHLRTARLSLFQEDYPDQYMFNLQSKHHLKKLFFEILNEEPLSRTELGSPQVNEEFLDLVAEKYVWAAKLIEFNKLVKIKSSYIERLLEKSEDGKFYPEFMQHRTVSGRYAGDLQQLPRPLEVGQASELVRKHNNRIREFIIAPSRYKLVSADYESLEPCVFAHTSGDPALIDIFKSGKDFYSEVAIRTERLQGVSSDKLAANYLGKVNKPARQRAKAYALGIAYGMTGYKLHFELDCSIEEADKLVNDYLTAFPLLARWMRESKDKAITHGFVATESGRLRRLPRAQSLFRKHGASLDNNFWIYREYGKDPLALKQAKEDRKEYKNLLNNAINFQVQGLAASIVNRAAIELSKRSIRPIMQVHDELVFEVAQEDVPQACATIQQVMSNIMKLKVNLVTVPQVGTNFRECK